MSRPGKNVTPWLLMLAVMSSNPLTDQPVDAEAVDVVIVGAGLSGVGAAYRLQTGRPGTSYAVLEAREDLGGTWSLFRYPGIRSDSDMYTLGYAFKPWRDGKSLADGASILEYIRDTATEFGIDRHIRYSTKVVAAEFDSTTARWTLMVEDPRDGTRRTMTCNFLYSCAGYYDYDNPHTPQFPDSETFSGTIVHPQFWPSDLDHAGKRVVVIGSGATAVTLVPALLDGHGRASHVTMLQRTPTWISPVPARDAIADRLKSVLPPGLAHRLIRTKNIAFNTAFYQYCRRRPAGARKLLNGLATKIVGDAAMVSEHFTPTYDPWDQRLCAVPDGDLFTAIRKGSADVITDHVDAFVPEGIRLRQFVWNGAMITGVPNFAVCIGYTNASWTLRADITHRLVCKVLAWMERNDFAIAEPQPDRELTPRPLLDLASGYVQRSIKAFPRQGQRAPWLVRQNYVLDLNTTLRTNLRRTLRTTSSADLQQHAAELDSRTAAAT